MNDQRIAIITDSGTDVPADFAARHDVRTVALRINYADGTSYQSGVDITADEVVGRLDEEVPKTSLPSPEDLRSAIMRARRDGYISAVVVTIASGLSATNATARLVAADLYGFPVTVVDTRSIGVAAGMVVMEAVRMVEDGVPFGQLGAALDAVADRTRVFFSVQELGYLYRGGRIGAAVFRLGSALNIKPVMTCEPREGRYEVASKARGWRRALEAELRLACAEAQRHARVRVAMCAHADVAALDFLERGIRERLGNVVEVIRTGVSADLLVHTGPSLVGIAVQGL